MNRIIPCVCLAIAVAACAGQTGVRAQEPSIPSGPELDAVVAKVKDAMDRRDDKDGKKYRDFNEVIKGSENLDGLFTLHRKDEHLYAEIKHHQFDQPLLAPIAIARGMAMAGTPLNFGDEWVLVFHRAGDKVQLIRRNIHYKATAGTPLEKAVKQNYTDSILMALPIVSINPAGQSVLIDLSDIFLTDFAELGLGVVDRNRTTWHKVKAFPNNVELEVEATYQRGGLGGMFMGGGDDGVADHRGITMVIHYSLVKLPEFGYKPRHADDRVGHFLSALKDFGLDDPDTTFVRQINRWRLEKADSKAKLSPPKRRIVWWVEETVPDEYRPFVESGILEWNKAFEKVGFRNAIEVRWQDTDRLGDSFDPEDINYCTFRWITTPGTFAMSCLRANPITGEMIDGDVIFDASWIRHWKNEYALMTGTGMATSSNGQPIAAPITPLAFGEVISPIMAAKRGYGLPVPLPSDRFRANLNRLDNAAAPQVQVVPSQWTGAQVLLRQRLARGQFVSCQFSSGMRPELGLAALALADAGKTDASGKVPEEFIGQAIKEVVMHEVGHSLGLRHNFKASTMLTAEQLNDTAITHEKGNTGSVMDYNPINIAPRGRKQGDYYSTTIGPYDYWAIEYAYKPIDGDETTELKKIADRSPDPDLVYATDEDMFLDNDPLVNTYDLGSDTCQFARDRITLATELMKGVDAKLVKDGEAWSRLQGAFSILMSQWGNAAFLAASHVGGQSVSRDHKGSKNAHDPILPAKGAKQREALKLVVEEILSDKAFKFSPALLRKLANERWYHWGNEGMFSSGGVEFPIYQRVLSIQQIVLGQCLAADVLSRLQNQEQLADEGSEPLRMEEVFRALTDGIWSECTVAEGGDAKDRTVSCSTIRRNLQREHLKKLSAMVLGSKRSPYDDMYGYIMFFGSQSVPADARSLARLHLKEINARINKTLSPGVKIDDTTRAHLEECQAKIGKVLTASIDLNEP
ncbi:MAG TPA: zinc-dependent metalloprotease [Isosphaeraceae bacterium]|jgi:hypothetical protein|nr:zinc-dependent metalloprotease [Isosphaeraceae bacterium]